MPPKFGPSFASYIGDYYTVHDRSRELFCRGPRLPESVWLALLKTFHPDCDDVFNKTFVHLYVGPDRAIVGLYRHDAGVSLRWVYTENLSDFVIGHKLSDHQPLARLMNWARTQ